MFAAVQTVYWETGWSGFTIDAVAKTAGVGRAAIYRRWPTKIQLLIAALEKLSPLHDPIDTGTTRGDLKELTHQLLTGYQSQAGLIALRVALDARVFPELLEPLTRTISASRFATTRDIVRRAIDRGDLPPHHQHHHVAGDADRSRVESRLVLAQGDWTTGTRRRIYRAPGEYGHDGGYSGKRVTLYVVPSSKHGLPSGWRSHVTASISIPREIFCSTPQHWGWEQREVASRCRTCPTR